MSIFAAKLKVQCLGIGKSFGLLTGRSPDKESKKLRAITNNQWQQGVHGLLRLRDTFTGSGAGGGKQRAAFGNCDHFIEGSARSYGRGRGDLSIFDRHHERAATVRASSLPLIVPVREVVQMEHPSTVTIDA